ncbi:hypothetical protein [Pseudomonas oryzihabitans]|uniref:hypothetical protein n=1 Tax=Pseudomonas oryzihabitans TaxID=47885 RepID=UPI001CA4058A|nr:hypothetical protein [Pseudomonas psychrotolerans]
MQNSTPPTNAVIFDIGNLEAKGWSLVDNTPKKSLRRKIAAKIEHSVRVQML